MSRFVVCVWNEFANEYAFEQSIPLEFNGCRLRSLGEPNRVDILVLAGFHRLSDRYIGRLRDLGYSLHDGEALAAECATRIPLLVDSYRHWTGIKHYGILRFLVTPRFFPGEDVILLDGDMVFNAGFDEMEAAVGDRLYFLGRSSCFASIPAKSGFFDLFGEHLMRFLTNPDAYARDTMQLPDASHFLDPHRAGTDQAFISHLQVNGVIDADFDTLTDRGLFAFSNWLTLDEAPGRPFSYKRDRGLDYLNGLKVLVSHMSNDTWLYLWAPMALSRLFGSENLAGFGRIPLLQQHYEGGVNNDVLRDFILNLREAFRVGQPILAGDLDFCSRRAVLKKYYQETDLGEVFNNSTWHTPGMVADA